MAAPAGCDWERLGATGVAGLLVGCLVEVGVSGSVGSTASKRESWLGADEAWGFIEIA